MKTILILKGPGDGEAVIDGIATRWSRDGHRVLSHHGPRGIPKADVVVLHVNATRISRGYQRGLRGHLAVVNGGAVDISKPLYVEHEVRTRDGYDGPVIVKTKRNFGGSAEQNRLWLPWRLFSQRVLRRGWRRRAWLHPHSYPIFEHPRDVPAGIWANSRLIVERFVPEREGDLFYVRYWCFFGDQGWAGRFGSREPIAKFSTRVTPEEPVPVPAEVADVRRRLGVDYGRIDFVQHGDETFVFDVNKTLGGDWRSGWVEEMDMLARGIDGFLSAARA